mmetsp:Transcript_17336/g.16544  ORF Transcript_17336/g.16544 Transcript_17336/m.16544 type:complete len:154 (-) Transcript_17336:28-489(-)|eukprot:CAMPEP_0170556650 /NCGR_PEP_ID=MMETSP0211-20121228/17997_1 /TAXON_ID=311385 /ORGANISM="Pseudokeronopsis sp., Strain OXSARD2" /LENGTH=153 /DNA_ID=CAMNT_0010867125 /DNA_START=288 /DNA_END=749 /DNA_ORIENTATION=-
MFVDDLVFTYITVLLLSVLDFWVVKNITGRLLVGLRWWNEIKDDGSEQWVFESLDEKNVNKSDGRVFWYSMYITPAIWIVFIIVSALKFNVQNITICVIGLFLAFTNLGGYVKCAKNHQQKLKGFLYDQAQKRLTVQQMAKLGAAALKSSVTG